MSEKWSEWVGRTREAHDTIRADQARALAATLEGVAPVPAPDDALPPLWHWIFFHDVAPASELGADGHPKRGDFLPPVPLPRRMWAGGRLTFHRDLPLDARAVRRSTIRAVTPKDGRSGQLCFVTVHHAIEVDGRMCVEEEHDIVYRDEPAPGATTPVPPQAPEGQGVEVVPDPILLFRYSALTFNGHRIHYDRPYATQVEGYDGLIVHGPLIATLLAGLAARQGRLVTFAFRAVSPLFDTTPFSIASDGAGNVWAANADGGLAMKAESTFA